MDCCLAAKNHKHSLSNPYAQFRAGYSEAEVLASPQITNELTKFMCSPTSVEQNKPRFISGEPWLNFHIFFNNPVTRMALRAVLLRAKPLCVTTGLKTRRSSWLRLGSGRTFRTRSLVAAPSIRLAMG